MYKEELEKAAIMSGLEPEEAADLFEDMAEIINMIKSIGKAEKMTHADSFVLFDELEEDKKAEPFSKEEMTKNSAREKDGMFSVPGVV